jgi:sulfate adenylyltransferase subunit 2
VTHLVASGEHHSVQDILKHLEGSNRPSSRRQILRDLDGIFGSSPLTSLSALRDASGAPLIEPALESLDYFLTSRRSQKTLVVYRAQVGDATLLVANDKRGERWWVKWNQSHDGSLTKALTTLREIAGKDLALIPHGLIQEDLDTVHLPFGVTLIDYAHSPLPYRTPPRSVDQANTPPHPHLDALEAESIRIIRETVAVGKKPGMLFSMGKDSMVMLTLARKAFWPEPIPFPLVLIDSRWEFQEMYRFREHLETKTDFELIVHVNPDGVRDEINPFIHGSAHHTEVTRTQGLKQVLDTYQFDYVFGGARRDEEKSRAKERIFSIRNSRHGWDPKNQRPELWNLYNTTITPGQSMRVFPISNWTELDVWRYIEREAIELIPLYFSKVRPFVERKGALIMVDDERFIREPGEKIHFAPIRFRTLGCYPLTGGVRSEATTVADIISELENSRVSERSSRVIDFDPGASMEQKKKEGYF